jgi:hypothetical protein
MRTIFHLENDGLLDSRTDSAQILPESEPTKMKFPKVIRHRKAEVTIYGKKKNYPFYRIAYRADGKRLLVNFAKYSLALAAAEKKAKELSEGSPAAALTAAQARDALTALQMLDTIRQQGQRISLSTVVSEYIEVSKKLGDRTLREAADGFIKTVATVTRIDIGNPILKHSSLLQLPLSINSCIKGSQLVWEILVAYENLDLIKVNILV